MSRSESVASLYQDEGNKKQKQKNKQKAKSKTKGTKMFMYADDIVPSVTPDCPSVHLHVSLQFLHTRNSARIDCLEAREKNYADMEKKYIDILKYVCIFFSLLHFLNAVSGLR